MKHRNWREMAERGDTEAGKNINKLAPGKEIISASQVLDHLAEWLDGNGNRINKETLSRVMKGEFGKYDLDLETRVVRVFTVESKSGKSSLVRHTDVSGGDKQVDRLEWGPIMGMTANREQMNAAMMAKFPRMTHGAVIQIEEAERQYYFCATFFQSVSGQGIDLRMFSKGDLVPQGNATGRQSNGTGRQQAAQAM